MVTLFESAYESLIFFFQKSKNTQIQQSVVVLCSSEKRNNEMDLSRERLIGRHNRTPQTSICRSLVGFAIMIMVTCTLLIVGLVLTGQAKTAAQILSSHKRCEQSETVIIAHRGASGMRPGKRVNFGYFGISST